MQCSLFYVVVKVKVVVVKDTKYKVRPNNILNTEINNKTK